MTCIAMALLAACGGSGGGSAPTPAPSPSFTIGGAITGLTGSIALRNNGVDELIISENGTFAFSTQVARGGTYAVTVQAQPSDPAQNCVVTQASGLVSANVANVAVVCSELSKPELLAAAGASSAQLRWTVPQQADRIDVYISSSPECEMRSYASCPDGARFTNVSSPHTVSGLRNGQSYYFQLETVYGNGARGLSNLSSARPNVLAFNDEIHNHPFFNSAGTAMTVSSAGSIDLSHPFHLPIGTNGRTCESCHLPHAGWSIRPVDVELLFLLTGGTDPLFNAVDADRPAPDLSSPASRYASFTMLRQGLFRRGGAIPANAEFEIIAVDDPLGAGANSTTFRFFRRPLPTANFHIAKNIGWHDQFTAGSGDAAVGLSALSNAVTIGALQGQPLSLEMRQQMVAHQMSLTFAQESVFGIGSLTSCGAKGGAEYLAAQLRIDAPFDLFDAWIALEPGSCTSETADLARAQIAHGQQLFNGVNANGRSCRGCHNAQNDGGHTSGALFDVRASRAEFRKPGMPLYTVRNTQTLDERQTTDPGAALRTGRWADMDRFKTPSLRGAIARPPYFHNGIAATLRDVVLHYENALGFIYDDEERDALVAFLEAL